MQSRNGQPSPPGDTAGGAAVHAQPSDGELTSAGREAHAAVENATDWAAARPWARLGPDRTAGIVTALTPLAHACATALPYPSPVGVPAPGAVG